MRPIQLTLRNFKSHPDTDIDWRGMHIVAITGRNGAGKSSILDGWRYALYGAQGLGLAKQADSVVKEGATLCEVVLVFEVAGQRYRVRRERKLLARGVSDVQLARWDDSSNDWVSATKGTSADTQAEIDRIVGVDYLNWLRTVDSAQGKGGAFVNADPIDRKKTVQGALGLDAYPALAKTATGKAAAALAVVAPMEAEKERLQAAVEAVAALNRDQAVASVAQAVTARENAAQRVKDAQKEHADARVAAAAGEQARQLADTAEETARAAEKSRAYHEQQRDTALREKNAAEESAGKLATLEAARPELVDVSELQAAEKAAMEAATVAGNAVTDAKLRHQDHQQLRKNTELAFEQRKAAEAKADAALKRVDDLDAQPQADCPTCEQALGVDARVKTREKFVADLTAAQAELDGCKKTLDTAQEAERLSAERGLPDVEALTTAHDAAGRKWTEARTALSEAAKQNEAHHAAAGPIEAAKAAAVNVPTLTEKWKAAEAELESAVTRAAQRKAEAEAARKNAAGADTTRIDQLAAAVTEAEAAEKTAAQAVSNAERELERVSATLEQSAKDQARIDEIVRDSATAKGEGMVYEILARAFGVDGIPLQVLRTAKTKIEHDVNDSLVKLGAPYTCRLDLEKLNGKGELADALDITVLADGQERPVQLLSGGEATRLNTAMRVAISRLLAHRSGVRVQTLILDEPDGLDAAGFAALADTLKGLGDEFELIATVSHTTGLESACDTVLRVDKDENGSRVVVAS